MTNSGRVTLTSERIGPDETLLDVENFIVGVRYRNTISSEGSPVVSTVWTIAPFPVFLNFVATREQSIYTPMPSTLTMNPLVIVFAAAGMCAIKCFVTLADGYTEWVSADVTVNSPTLTNGGGVLQDSAEFLGVYPNKQMRYSNGTQDGVDASVEVVSCGLGDDGEICVAQVVTPQRWVRLASGRVLSCQLNGVPSIDLVEEGATIAYQGSPEPLTNGGSAVTTLRDSPAQMYFAELDDAASIGYDLSNNDQLVPEAFTSWVMYRPVGGCWVPLASFSWQVAMLAADFRIQEQAFTPGPVSWSPTTTFPSWTACAQNGGFGDPLVDQRVNPTF